jgi:hypothetical protein
MQSHNKKEGRIMKKNIATIGLMLMMTASMSGCASFLTMMSPARSETVISETKPGGFAGYDYRYQISGAQLHVARTSLYTEIAKGYQVTKKKEIGYGPAMLEMPLYGLGLIDLLNAYAISEYSEKITPVADYETGNLIAFGEEEPAAGIQLVIENREKGVHRIGVTDENGMLDLKNLLKDIAGPIPIEVRMVSDTQTAFCFTYRRDPQRVG